MSSSRNPRAPHPRDALFAGERPFPVIPACEHFAGSEKLIVKALELQAKIGALFDITCDCEDGAEAGKEKQHAEMIVDVLASPRNTLGMAGGRIPHYNHAARKKGVGHPLAGPGQALPVLSLSQRTF